MREVVLLLVHRLGLGATLFGNLAHFSLPLPRSRHEFELKRPESLSLRGVGLAGLHINLGSAHGAFALCGFNIQGGMQTLRTEEMP